MKVIIYNTDTQEQKYVDYLKSDNTEIIGLAENIKIYAINEDNLPEYDSLSQKIVRIEEMTNIPDTVYPFLNKFQISWNIEQLPNEDIIGNLNNYIGDYLDGHYPIWKRIKYLNLYTKYQNNLNNLTVEELADLNFIKGVESWVDDCRSIRDAMEIAIIESSIIPDVRTFPTIPIK